MKDREPIQVTAGEAEGEYHIRFPRKYHDMLEGYARRRHADLPDAIAIILRWTLQREDEDD